MNLPPRRSPSCPPNSFECSMHILSSVLTHFPSRLTSQCETTFVSILSSWSHITWPAQRVHGRRSGQGRTMICRSPADFPHDASCSLDCNSTSSPDVVSTLTHVAVRVSSPSTPHWWLHWPQSEYLQKYSKPSAPHFDSSSFSPLKAVVGAQYIVSYTRSCPNL